MFTILRLIGIAEKITGPIQDVDKKLRRKKMGIGTIDTNRSIGPPIADEFNSKHPFMGFFFTRAESKS